MKFKTAFVLGAAAGAWAVQKFSEMQHRPAGAGAGGGTAADEATEKLRAVTGLARERLSDLVEGPLGNMARERIADLIGTSLGAGKSSGRPTSSDNGTIDTTANWPNE